MTLRAHFGDLFLQRVADTVAAQGSSSFAISGDAARCLWMLHTIPDRSRDIWKRICHPWPDEIEVVTAVASPPQPPARADTSSIAREFGPTMLSSRQWVSDKQALLLPVVAPAFVLAEILTEDDPLLVTRVADLLRCLESGDIHVDPETVRILLKAVRAGDRFDTLVSVINSI